MRNDTLVSTALEAKNASVVPTAPKMESIAVVPAAPEAQNASIVSAAQEAKSVAFAPAALEAENVTFRYAPGLEPVLRDVSMHVSAGERVALVGPSGCGKSTLAKILSGYLAPTSGAVRYSGAPLVQKGFCPVQMIHQHPELSINPRLRMGRILCESWTPDAELLSRMGIEEAWMSRWPAELSGGELQRFCIARALDPRTRFLLCDEISTMLDVITQAQIWEVLLEIAETRGLGLLVVTHDVALARRTCTRVVSLGQTDVMAMRKFDKAGVEL